MLHTYSECTRWMLSTFLHVHHPGQDMEHSQLPRRLCMPFLVDSTHPPLLHPLSIFLNSVTVCCFMRCSFSCSAKVVNSFHVTNSSPSTSVSVAARDYTVSTNYTFAGLWAYVLEILNCIVSHCRNTQMSDIRVLLNSRIGCRDSDFKVFPWFFAQPAYIFPCFT